MAATKEQLKDLVASIQKTHGAGSVMLDDGTGAVKDVAVVRTGALPMDLALGIGGLPQGRIAEIYGPESSGKTTICYHIIAEAQKAGLTCAFIDAEHAVDKGYATRIGVNFDELLFSQPDHGEQALEIAALMIDSGLVKVLCIDSVAALVPKAEIEGEIGDSFVGLQARLMSQAMRKLSGACNRQNAMVLFTNQLREKIGVMFGSPETTPGGRALKFYASIRMDIRRIETMKEGKESEAVGQMVRIKFVKNKLAPPNRQAEFPIRYGIGIDRVGIVLAYATDDKKRVTIPKDMKFDLIKKAGGNHTFPNGEKANSGAAARQYLVEHPELVEQLEQVIMAKVQGQEVDVDAIQWSTASVADNVEEPVPAGAES